MTAIKASIASASPGDLILQRTPGICGHALKTTSKPRKNVIKEHIQYNTTHSEICVGGRWFIMDEKRMKNKGKAAGGNKALIISVGTGTKDEESARESLAKAIVYSVENNNPNKVLFVTSAESAKKTIPLVLPKINAEYELFQISDTDDIQKICEDLSPKFREIRDKYRFLAVDYTSGTKAMTAALAILGSIYDADTLTYVGGKREGGIVQGGTETMHIVRPTFVTAEKRRMEAISLFNQCRFDAAIFVIEQFEKTTADKDALSRFSNLKSAALAYSCWDRFEHARAFDHLKGVSAPEFSLNKAFLGKLLSAKDEEKQPFYIADLISNAMRRGDVENKYDDAVARLYRVMELIAQYRLRDHGIESTGRVSVDRIPIELRKKWNITHEETVEIGLQKDYELLQNFGDPLGEKASTDEGLMDLLSKRNFSILAHGLSPVSGETYKKLLDRVRSYALMVVNNLEGLLSDSKFVEWSD